MSSSSTTLPASSIFIRSCAMRALVLLVATFLFVGADARTFDVVNQGNAVTRSSSAPRLPRLLGNIVADAREAVVERHSAASASTTAGDVWGSYAVCMCVGLFSSSI